MYLLRNNSHYLIQSHSESHVAPNLKSSSQTPGNWDSKYVATRLFNLTRFEELLLEDNVFLLMCGHTQRLLFFCNINIETHKCISSQCNRTVFEFLEQILFMISFLCYRILCHKVLFAHLHRYACMRFGSYFYFVHVFNHLKFYIL